MWGHIRCATPPPPTESHSVTRTPTRRPARLEDDQAEAIIGAPDPAEASLLAHETAQALVDGGRGRAGDPELVARLVGLVESEGLETLAEMWSGSPANTLPGTLWRLYLIREWVRRDPRHIALNYRRGLELAEVAGVIAGVADTPGPEDVRRTADRILSGVFDGDLDVALDRASSFLKVLAAGSALGAESLDATDSDLSALVVQRASALLNTAEDLQHAAGLARAGTLE